MSEYFDAGAVAVMNPYDARPAMDITAQSNHDGGNVLAANTEARAIAEVKAQVIMAKQFPRDGRTVADKVLQECARPTLAEAAVYTFPRGKETVTGPSIRLAEVLARNWGNCTFGYEVLERKPASGKTPGCSVVSAYAWDLETNIRVARQFEVKHWRSTKSGGYALTDDRDIYELEANMASRRIRACILQMIPGDLTNMAVEACRASGNAELIQQMANPDTRKALVAKTIKVYAKMGVEQNDLEEYLGIRSDNWNADHMAKLKDVLNTIRDGAAPMGEFFPRLADIGKTETITKEQVSELMKAIADTGRQGEISDALKQLGFPKVADVTAVQLEQVKKLIATFAKSDEEKQIEG